ncbi:MAG: response regulator [Tannerella sp.]|jgi:signal transduction histidine kinase/ActR/RegA family two-component response regulator|nr:response regulator [Tannerella sp.]
MKKTIENKIHINVVFIYMIAIILCCAMLLFFYHSRKNINEQKKNIETHDQIMAETKELVHCVNQAQQEVNQYIESKQTAHLDSFHVCLHEIDKQIDTLKIYTTDSVPTILFQELRALLHKKEETVAELKYLFQKQAFSQNMHERIKTIETTDQPNSVKTKTYLKQDTIIKEQKKKNLWKRITAAFSSKQPSDTIISSSSEITDTIKIASDHNSNAIVKRDTIIKNVRIDYQNHISSIEEQVIRLILSDQEISSRISNLLINLYNNFLYSRLDEIMENEHWLLNNNTISFIIASIALFLILLFIFLIINDVNKGLRMRKSLEEANLRTKQLMESRHQLLLSVSHDIKTPLNSMLCYLELNSSSDELTMNDLSSMSNSGKYILALLENLLEFSSLQQGTLTTSLSKFNIYDLCEDVKEMFIPLSQQKGLAFHYTFNLASDLFVTSDSLKIKQVIINILSNAVKYTSEGKIDFQVDMENETLSILISDTGIGIPEKQIDQVFQPFTRIDENKNMAEGTGFGMYVVKGLVDLLAGEITVKSAVNKGTSVYIKFPVRIAADDNRIAAVKKILVIDDDPSFSNLLGRMLERLGHTAYSCSSFAEFEKYKLQLSGFDLVLTDMEIGNYSGMDVLHNIRQRNRSLPVFIITGKSDFSGEQAVSAGFNGYLPKPVTLDALSNAVNQTVPVNDRLKSLREMFDNDEDLIREVIQTFIHTTEQNLSVLKQCIENNTFTEAQAVCHKMLPMFLQTGEYHPAEFLRRMDLLKGKPETIYPEWKKDAAAFITEAEEMLTVKASF